MTSCQESKSSSTINDKLLPKLCDRINSLPWLNIKSFITEWNWLKTLINIWWKKYWATQTNPDRNLLHNYFFSFSNSNVIVFSLCFDHRELIKMWVLIKKMPCLIVPLGCICTCFCSHYSLSLRRLQLPQKTFVKQFVWT